jgi:hypothetical protein
MDRRCGSSGRLLALQEQSPEDKPQSHTKQKKKKKGEEENCKYHVYLLLQKSSAT